MFLQLRNQPTTDAANLAAIGYCFGGGVGINVARYGPNGTDGLRGELHMFANAGLTLVP